MRHTQINCIQTDFNSKLESIEWKCNRKSISKDETTLTTGLNLVESELINYHDPEEYWEWTNSYFTAIFPSFFPNFLIRYFLNIELNKIKPQYNHKIDF